MLQKFLPWLIQLSPNTKRGFWKWWYNTFATRAPNPDFKFMNYGYDADGFNPVLKEKDEHERYPIHLYHHVASRIDLSGKTVLEVGSGRGGGASYVARYLNPSMVQGIDISETAVSLCNQFHTEDNLSFTEGNSEDIPFDDGEFDVVLNVESSHCYGDMDQFLSEIRRVLKPGGYFLWCDLRQASLKEELDLQFQNCGLDMIQKNNITPNIISALEIMSEKRKRAIGERVPFLLRNVFESYAGVKGSRVHDSFINGQLIYLSATFQKPD